MPVHNPQLNLNVHFQLMCYLINMYQSAYCVPGAALGTQGRVKDKIQALSILGKKDPPSKENPNMSSSNFSVVIKMEHFPFSKVSLFVIVLF